MNDVLGEALMRIDDEMRQTILTEVIREKSKLLSRREKRQLGDRLIQLVEKEGVKYGLLTMPPFHDSDSDEDNTDTEPQKYLFPLDIYRESLQTLHEILSRPCNCPNPEKSHKYCSIDLQKEYTTFDNWYLGVQSDHVLSSPSRIREIADELDCPYKLLIGKRSLEIIDWINTNERLGWVSPPPRRRFFLEDMKFTKTKENFNKNQDIYSLFDLYCTWVREETNVRKRINILSRAMGLLANWGSSNDYFSIVTQDKMNNKRLIYYFPYSENDKSCKYLSKAIKEEKQKHKPKDSHSWEERCRCGIIVPEIISSEAPRPVHEGALRKTHTISQEMREPKLFIVKKMVDVEKMRDIVTDICPLTLLDNDENLAKLFVHN